MSNSNYNEAKKSTKSVQASEVQQLTQNNAHVIVVNNYYDSERDLINIINIFQTNGLASDLLEYVKEHNISLYHKLNSLYSTTTEQTQGQ